MLSKFLYICFSKFLYEVCILLTCFKQLFTRYSPFSVPIPFSFLFSLCATNFFIVVVIHIFCFEDIVCCIV